MKFSTLAVMTEQQIELNNLVEEFNSGSWYKFLSQKEIPSVFPETLKQKLSHAILMVDKSTTFNTFLMCNGVRIDSNSSAIDDQPFGIVITSTGASTEGIIIHHGDWLNRTKELTQELKTVLNSTSLADYYPVINPPLENSGHLSELDKTSHLGAFKAIVNYFEEKKSH